MNIIKKYLLQGFGFFCIAMAYIGFVTPGIPFSIFLVMAAWALLRVHLECTNGYTTINTLVHS